MGGEGLTIATGLLLCLCLCACSHPWALAPDQLAKLREGPGRYLSGRAIKLRPVRVLENKDFAYTVDFSPESQTLAFSHLAALDFRLTTWKVDPEPEVVVDAKVNLNEFDVEGLAFSPDGQRLAVASRDGSVRVYRRGAPEPAASYLSEEPLVSVAFDPSGKYLVTGSAKGLLTVLKADTLAFASDLRAHRDEVRALAFGLDGTLYSGSWDKSIARLEIQERERPAGQISVAFVRAAGLAAIRGSLDGRASGGLGFDARASHIVVSTALAQAAGIDVPFLKDSVVLQSPVGPTEAKITRGHTLTFKDLDVAGLDLVICDACVPKGMDGLLGASFLEKVEIRFDEAQNLAHLALKEKGPAPTVRAPVLNELRRFTYPGFVQDLSVDHTGTRLGVAFGEVKAERNLDVYQREKKGVTEPFREGNCAAIVDAKDGQVIKRYVLHRGVVATAGISPDGHALVSGGWDKQLLLLRDDTDAALDDHEFGWSVRRARFSPDGRFVGVASWTPQKASGNGESDPAVVLYGVEYELPQVEDGSARSP